MLRVLFLATKSLFSLYQHVLGSFNKRQCAAHQREECLNRLLDQTPAALTFSDSAQEETQVVPKTTPVPEERVPTPPTIIQVPLTASQFLSSAQSPASSESKRFHPFPISSFLVFFQCTCNARENPPTEYSKKKAKTAKETRSKSRAVRICIKLNLVNIILSNYHLLQLLN